MSASLTARYLDYAASGLNDGTSETNAWQTWAAADAALLDGEKLWVKANSGGARQSLTGEGNISFTLTTATGAEVEAYTTTIGDKGVAKFNLADSVQTLSFAEGMVIEGLDFENSGTLAVWQVFLPCVYIRCRHKTNGNADLPGTHKFCYYTTTGNGKTLFKPGSVNIGGFVHGCLLEHTGVSGTNRIISQDCFGSSLSVTRSIFVGVGSATTSGIFLDRLNSGDGVYLRENIFYNLNDAVTLDEKGDIGVKGQENFLATRNILDTIAAYILNETSSTTGDDWSAKLIDNWYRAVTSGVNNIPGALDRDNVLLTADPFDNAGSDDFDLNNTAGGGAVLRAAGMPINMAYDWTNMAVRAVFEGGAGGGGLLVHPGMDGGLSG